MDHAVIQKAHSFNTDLMPAVMTDAQIEQYLQSVGERIIATAKERHLYARHVQKGMYRQMGLVGATTGSGDSGFAGGRR